MGDARCWAGATGTRQAERQQVSGPVDPRLSPRCAANDDDGTAARRDVQKRARGDQEARRTKTRARGAEAISEYRYAPPRRASGEDAGAESRRQGSGGGDRAKAAEE